ncbi:hypothetical protein BpHYR1_018848 [Brachionus plicatilis]|uniref:Uncharacterized protein n=1 Tax=Brachionus plicatilis TaxID=10195 RepID=A0A3M7RVI5_BRAPC|nr:hypothetical protein BpHYR1_018848 [Brachionus plicatilis]
MAFLSCLWNSRCVYIPEFTDLKLHLIGSLLLYHKIVIITRIAPIIRPKRPDRIPYPFKSFRNFLQSPLVVPSVQHRRSPYSTYYDVVDLTLSSLEIPINFNNCW